MRLRTRRAAGGDLRDAPSATTTRRKGRLFCPECGHEDQVDGDWVREESTDRTSYACPECEHVLVSQPAF